MLRRWFLGILHSLTRLFRHDVARLEIRIQDEPRIADGADQLVIDIEALDRKRRPVSNAAISVGLILGLDELERAEGEHLGGGHFRASFSSLIAGDAVVHAWDRRTGISAKKLAGFIAGEPVEVAIIVGNAVPYSGGLAYEILATVDDRNGNPTMRPRAELVLETNFGDLSLSQAQPDGTFISQLRVAGPGIATIKAKDLQSGLEANVELSIPAIALECPSAVHLTDEPGQRNFQVTVRLFTGTQALGGYNIAFDFNALTAFAGVEDAPGLPSPRVQLEGSNRVRISQSISSPSQPPSGYFQIATLIFECLDEGDSEVSVGDAVLTSFRDEGQLMDDGSNGELLADQPREVAVCPNKRVKHVCIKPILIKGVVVEQEKINALTDTLKAHLKIIQENLDQGCCTIELGMDPLEELEPPQLYSDEVKENKDRASDKQLPQVEWDARRADQGSTMPGKIVLSPGMAALLCDRSKRKDECINVYIVADESMVGHYPAIDTAQEEDREATKKVTPETQKFGGADIKRQRIAPNGSGCETVKIIKRVGKDEVDIPETDCQINAVVISPGNLKDYETLKHEIGHMLGLRHPWEYDDETLKKIKGNETEKGRSIMWYGRNRHVYTAEECNMVTHFNCNGYQK